MKFNLDQFLPKKEDPDFLVLDVGLQRLTGAVFRTTPAKPAVPKLMGLGRKIQPEGTELTDLLPETLKTIETIVSSLPKKVLLGVSGFGTKTATIVAKVERPDSSKPVSEEELQEILA